MTRDAAATRARLLTAAIEEFAAHGLAGGRVERIARAAGANPNSLYSYYGSKEALFHAAVNEALHALGEQVPVTPDDLPGFAGRLFDWLNAHPEAVRLGQWRNLEAPEAGPDDTDEYIDLVRHMATGAVGDAAVPPADLLLLVQAMAAGWVLASRDVRRADGRDPADPGRVAAYRTALIAAVRRLQVAEPLG